MCTRECFLYSMFFTLLGTILGVGLGGYYGGSCVVAMHQCEADTT